MLTRRADRRLQGDDGTTFAELMVCMALTTLVGAMALGFFVWTGSSTRATAGQSFTNQNARVAMTTATGILRLTVPGSVTPGAVDGATGVSSTVSFSASDNVVGGCPRRPAASVVLKVVSGTLQLSRTGPVSAATSAQPCAYRSAVASTRVLATGVRTGTGFAYTYRVVNGEVSTDKAQIGSVDVTLVVAASGGRPQTYTATAVVSGG